MMVCMVSKLDVEHMLEEGVSKRLLLSSLSRVVDMQSFFNINGQVRLTELLFPTKLG